MTGYRIGPVVVLVAVLGAGCGVGVDEAPRARWNR